MSVIWIAVYGIIFSFSDKFPPLLGEAHLLTVFAVMLYLAALYLFLKKRKRLSGYGLCLPNYWRKKEIGWLIPLLSFSFANLYFSGSQIMLRNSWVMLLLMLFTVLLEELLFRGYLLVFLLEKCGIKSKTIGMIVSSALFGVFHLVNLFQGANILYTIVQMLCAFGLGLCLCVLVSRYQSLFPGVILHYWINLTSFDMGNRNNYILLFFFILSVFYIFYAGLLNRKLRAVS